MKVTALLVSIISVLELAAAQPHGRRHHAKRGVVIYEQDVVVHYVDQNGNPVSTAIEKQLHTANNDAPAAATQPAAAPAPAAPAATTTPYTGSDSTGSGSTGSGSTGSGSTAASGSGIVYSPYTASGGCKDQSQVDADFAKITGYSLVRIYGTDCNQATTVLKAAKAKGMKVFAGIYDIDDKMPGEISTLIAACKNDWGSIDTVSIGNEVVNAGRASPGTVVAAVNSARGQLRAAGYQGPVVTVDTFIALINHPELCQASDYAAANCHAFFAGVDSSTAGSYVAEQKAAVEKACGGKKTVITETGWPWQGSSNNKAIPSKADQDKAIGSLKSTFSSNPSDMILFTAFDDMWKQDNPATFGCEKFYGLLGSD